MTDILTLMEYHVTSAQDPRDALRKIRYQNFDVVVVNELFGSEDPDTNGVLIYLERLSMDTRQKHVCGHDQRPVPDRGLHDVFEQKR